MINPQWLVVSYLEQISVVLKMFAPLKFDYNKKDVFEFKDKRRNALWS